MFSYLIAIKIQLTGTAILITLIVLLSQEGLDVYWTGACRVDKWQKVS